MNDTSMIVMLIVVASACVGMLLWALGFILNVWYEWIINGLESTED